MVENVTGTAKDGPSSERNLKLLANAGEEGEGKPYVLEMKRRRGSNIFRFIGTHLRL